MEQPALFSSCHFMYLEEPLCEYSLTCAVGIDVEVEAVVSLFFMHSILPLMGGCSTNILDFLASLFCTCHLFCLP